MSQLDTAIARARRAQDQPHSLEQRTLSVQGLDRLYLADHTRLTAWWDEEPDEAARALGEQLGVEVLRVRTCNARSHETGRIECVWAYEWRPKGGDDGQV